MSGRRDLLLMRLTRAFPEEDWVWGEALLRELDAVPRRKQARWALGMLNLVVARAGRRLRRDGAWRRLAGPGFTTGLWADLITGAIVAADLAYSNLGPASSHPATDARAPVIVAYALLTVMFTSLGFFYRGRGKAIADCVPAALVSAVVIIVVAFVTTLVIDNVWLSVVARQPDKVYGLAHNGLFHNMRAYIDAQNIVGLIVVTPLGAAAAGVLGAIGALLRSRPDQPSPDLPTSART